MLVIGHCCFLGFPSVIVGPVMLTYAENQTPESLLELLHLACGV